MHYEKLGIGSNKAFEYSNLQLLHDKLHFFNFQVINVLGYQNILSSLSIISDFTPPLFTECKCVILLQQSMYLSMVTSRDGAITL